MNANELLFYFSTTVEEGRGVVFPYTVYTVPCRWGSSRGLSILFLPLIGRHKFGNVSPRPQFHIKLAAFFLAEVFSIYFLI